MQYWINLFLRVEREFPELLADNAEWKGFGDGEFPFQQTHRIGRRWKGSMMVSILRYLPAEKTISFPRFLRSSQRLFGPAVGRVLTGTPIVSTYGTCRIKGCTRIHYHRTGVWVLSSQSIYATGVRTMVGVTVDKPSLIAMLYSKSKSKRHHPWEQPSYKLSSGEISTILAQARLQFQDR